MIWLELLLVMLIISFGSVLLFGAPYLPTLKSQINAALDLAEVKKGQTMLELGCGDGRVVLAAAKKGINVVGYELNPLLAGLAWVRTVRYRDKVTIIWGNFWDKRWPKAEAIFVFLLPKYMEKLDQKIEESKQGSLKLVSFAFQVPDKTPSDQRSGVYLYDYK